MDNWKPSKKDFDWLAQKKKEEKDREENRKNVTSIRLSQRDKDLLYKQKTNPTKVIDDFLTKARKSNKQT